jgi:hypothetical protein
MIAGKGDEVSMSTLKGRVSKVPGDRPSDMKTSFRSNKSSTNRYGGSLQKEGDFRNHYIA